MALKYAKVVNEKTKLCEVGLGTNKAYYESIGMVEMDVEPAYDGNWYLYGYAPKQPAPTIEEQVKAKEQEYQMNRWEREIILAENSGASEFSKAKAQEIEDLAKQLRG